MKELGKINQLPINRFTDNGAYLMLSDQTEVLIPKRYLSGAENEGDVLEVFVYTDSEDRPVAVTDKPLALLDQFAVLEVKEVTGIGAFLDWGLEKDLLLPNSEMHQKVSKGDKVLVMVCIDHKTNRLLGVSKYEDFILSDTSIFEVGQEVDALVFDHTDLGFKALINGFYEGLIYGNETFKPLEAGDKVRAFVKKVREDGKIDLQLTPIGRQKFEEGAAAILETLEKHAFLPLNDKSDPEVIRETLAMSKKQFKQCIGQLYKKKKIIIKEDGIYLA
ncbi:S1-like domain-containing RNA-binding protein [Cyclobacterium sp.]|uniref:CvfB family protein n=1 Tax=Cyclobacterium sp. TaxID=1966343 RepID=UPI00198928C9|nr:S1-like domain-containing RNA-binding protein [Cyclobacterium sp.]MBD3630867.1 RNA-binding protein [Cyclobacterium sp.]